MCFYCFHLKPPTTQNSLDPHPVQLLTIFLLTLMSKSCLYWWYPKLSQALVYPTDNALTNASSDLPFKPGLGPDLFDLAKDMTPLITSSCLRHCLQ